MTDRLIIGRILAPHGVRGEMKVQSLSGEDAHFKALSRVWLKKSGREFEMKVRGVRGALPNLIIAFENVDSPEEAGKFRGAEVLAERDQAAIRKDGEFYYADLTGCMIVYHSVEMAEVKSVWDNGNCHMFECELKDGGIVQIPFQNQFIGDVDTDRKQIELLVDWILE